MKMITCNSLGGANCRWVGEAKTIDALAERVRSHAREMHKREWEEKMGRIPDHEMKEMIMKYAKDKWENTKGESKEAWRDTKEGAKEAWRDTKDAVKDTAHDVKEGTKDKAHKAKEKLS